jgi:hypothetical protein
MRGSTRPTSQQEIDVSTFTCASEVQQSNDERSSNERCVTGKPANRIAKKIPWSAKHRSLERTGCSNTCACGHSPRNGALQITHAEAKIAAHKNDKLLCRRNVREAGSAALHCKQTQVRGVGQKELTLRTKRNPGPCQQADDRQHHSKLDRSRRSDCPEDRCMWQQAWQKGYEKMDTRG